MITNNLIYVITILLIAIYFFLQYSKRNKSFGFVSFLFALHIYILISAVAYEFTVHQFRPWYTEFNISSIIYLTSLYAILFYAFTRHKDSDEKIIVINNYPLYRTISIVLVYFNLGAFIFYLPFAYNYLMNDPGSLRVNLTEVTQEGIATYGIVNTFFSNISNIFFLNIIFFFVEISRLKNNRIKPFHFLIIISSLSMVVYNLAFVGREGIVYWLLSFVAIYLFFKPFTNFVLDKKVKRILFLLLPLIVIAFMTITISRFGHHHTTNVTTSIIAYSGMQISNFDNRFGHTRQISYGRNVFPRLSEGLENADLITKSDSDTRLHYYDDDIRTGVFSTFIGQFQFQFGQTGTALVIIIMSVFIFRLFRKKRMFMHNILIMMLFYQIVQFGVFYYRHSVAELGIYSIILFRIVLKYSGSQNTLVITKQKNY